MSVFVLTLEIFRNGNKNLRKRLNRRADFGNVVYIARVVIGEPTDVAAVTFSARLKTRLKKFRILPIVPPKS